MSEFTGEIHPLADALPMLPSDELADLAQDMRRNVTAATAVYEEEADAADKIKAIMRAGNHAHLGDLA